MHKRLLTGLLLICALALSGCASTGRAAPSAACPALTPPPASLMQPPTAEQKVRAQLFEPQPSAMPRSEGSSE